MHVPVSEGQRISLSCRKEGLPILGDNPQGEKHRRNYFDGKFFQSFSAALRGLGKRAQSAPYFHGASGNR